MKAGRSCRRGCRRTCWPGARCAAAEANLVATNARITEARAQYFPAVCVDRAVRQREFGPLGSLQRAGRGLDDRGSLLQPSLAPVASRRQVDAATSQRDQAELDYVRTVSPRSAMPTMRSSRIAPRARATWRRRTAARSTPRRCGSRPALQGRLHQLHRGARQPAQPARRQARTAGRTARAAIGARGRLQGAGRRLVPGTVRAALKPLGFQGVMLVKERRRPGSKGPCR